jgi:hypothetical protein
MNLVKNLAAALLLASVLSVNVYAGDQSIPGYVPPPPQSATATAEETKNIETTETQEPTLAEELLVEAWISLLSLY